MATQYITQFEGLYEAPQVAQYLIASLRTDLPGLERFQRLSSQHLIRWVRNGLALRELATLSGRELILGFEDLISMRVVAVMRAVGVTWPKIHRAEQWLRERTGHRRPFAVERVWTETEDVFAELPEGFVAASQRGQLAFAGLLHDYLRNVRDLDFVPVNGYSVAAAWSPHPNIRLNPKIQFGAPCIAQTRVPTTTIWGMVHAGDSPQFVARAYGIPPERVSDALQWEERLIAATGKAKLLG